MRSQAKYRAGQEGLISCVNSNTSRANLNPELRSTQTSLPCKGCQDAVEASSEQVLSYAQYQALFDIRNRTFTEDIFSTISQHAVLCTEAQRMWTEHHGTNGRV